MRRLWMIAAAAAVLTVTERAPAATYLFVATGTTSSFYSVGRDFKQVANPPASIAPGDSVSVSFLLDTFGRTPEGLFATDPSVNIYYGSVTNFTLTIGSFATRAASGESNFASLQLWDNRAGTGFGPTDSFSISVLRGIPSSKSPISLGIGIINANFGFNAFDFLQRHACLIRSPKNPR